MDMINVVNGPQNVSRIVLGCMRMPALDVDSAAKMISCANELGINFFDHATCYGEGDVYTAPTATAARNICHTLPLTAHGHCPAKNEPA